MIMPTTSSEIPRAGHRANIPTWVRAAGLCAIVLSFGASLAWRPPPAPSAGFAWRDEPGPPPSAGRPVYRERFVNAGLTPFSHSAAVVELEDGRLRAFWKGGTTEGKHDVAIYSAVLDRHDGQWSPETEIISRRETRRRLWRHVIALGNPVAMRDGDRGILLWYVSVSVGGWSGSSINMVRSDDDGETWSAPRRLITSPFFNLSTLVKGPPFHFEDGTIGLPVYHENMGKFAELLRLSADGDVLHKQRLSWGRSTLQPVIVPSSRTEATCFLRRAGSAPRRLIALSTDDGGRTWTAPATLETPNPGSPVAAASLDSGELLLVFNDVPRGRGSLALSVTDHDARQHPVVRTLERSTAEFGEGLSYPHIVRTDDGDYHIFYTWHRIRIRHVHFNQSWLTQHLASRWHPSSALGAAPLSQ